MIVLLYKLITGETLIAPETNVFGLTATETTTLKLPMKIVSESGVFFLVPWISGALDVKVRTSAIIATTDAPDFLNGQYAKLLASASQSHLKTH